MDGKLIIICLGMKASGSTWVFNVARAIALKSGKKSMSFFCENSKELLDYIDIVDGFIVIKCHYVDEPFIKLMNMVKSKVIATVRDPRDCAVSLIERFSSDIKDISSDLSKSLSSISMFMDMSDFLPISYKDSPFDDIQTVKNIATFMGVDLLEDEYQSIFNSMLHDVIKEEVKNIDDNIENNMSFDIETHWHPNHVGDGAIGKWEQRLPENYRDSMTKAFCQESNLFSWPSHDIVWDSNMFDYYDNRKSNSFLDIVCDGRERCLIWGPYVHIPAGLWTIEFLIEPISSHNNPIIKVDILSSIHGIIELRSVNLSDDVKTKLSVDIENLNHLSRIEARVHSVGDGRLGRFHFNGIRIRSRGGKGLRDSGRATLIQ